MTNKATGDRGSATATGVLLATALLLAGCSTGGLFDSEAPVPRNYVLLPAKSTVAAAAEPLAVDLSIGLPSVAPGLESQRIAVLRGRELDYFRGVQWGGGTVDVVQSMLVASFHNRKLFRSVTAEQMRISAHYTLDCEVRDFQAEYAEGRSAPQVHVTVIARLIRLADRGLVETFSASAMRDAMDNRMTAVVASFESALQQVALELAQQSVAAVERDRQAAPAVAPSARTD